MYSAHGCVRKLTTDIDTGQSREKKTQKRESESRWEAEADCRSGGGKADREITVELACTSTEGAPDTSWHQASLWQAEVYTNGVSWFNAFDCLFILFSSHGGEYVWCYLEINIGGKISQTQRLWALHSNACNHKSVFFLIKSFMLDVWCIFFKDCIDCLANFKNESGWVFLR